MYSAHVIVDGFPGKSRSHGSFGWSSVWLLQGQGRIVLVETGPPSYVSLLSSGLADLGLVPGDVTDILLTHAHWDHVGNLAMFPGATRWIGGTELDWAAEAPLDAPFLSPLHTAELTGHPGRLGRVDDGHEVLPGIRAVDASGHTPGSLAYLAETTTESLIFAGDAVKNLHELTTAEVDSTMDTTASRHTVERLRALMAETGASLVPGHDVLLGLAGQTVQRRYPQHAQISFFAGATTGEEDRSISDDQKSPPRSSTPAAGRSPHPSIKNGSTST